MHNTAFGISLALGVIAGCWIIASDRLLAAWVSDPNSLNRWQTVKGLLSVVIASVLLYEWLRHERAAHERVENILRESEERYRTLVDQAADGIFITDSEGNYLDVNTSGCEMLGYTRAELLRLGIRQIVPSEGQAALIQRIEGLLSGKTVLSEHQLRRKDGVLVPVETSGRMLSDGRFVGIVRDITGRKQAEEELRERRELLQTIVDHIPVMLAFISAEGKTEWVNREWERVLGWSLEEARTQDILSQMYPDPVSRREALDFALEATSEWRDFCPTVRDGHTLDTAWANIRLSDGRSIGIGQNVTERKNTQERLHNYTTRLEILRELDRAILAVQSPKTVAEVALSHLRQLVPSLRASVTAYDFEANTAYILVADIEQETQLGAGGEITLDTFIDIEELRRGQYQLVSDTGALAAPRFTDQQLLAEGVRSYINMPLIFQGELIGSLNLGGDHPDAFSTEHIEIIQEVADLLAIALQQVRLYEQVQRYADELEQRVNERTVELAQTNARLLQEIRAHEQTEAAEREQRALAEALRDVAATLNSTLDLDAVFERILASVGRVVPHDFANIMLIEDGIARVVRGKGYDREVLEGVLAKVRFVVGSVSNLRTMAESGQPMVIPDIGAYPGWVRVPGMPQSKLSYAGAPIRRGEKTIGFLNLESTQPGFFTAIHAERLGIFADEAAIAIQNAQSYVQVQELTVLEERHRLARDLHDAVSQTLWSASLVADLLPTVWEQDTIKGREQLWRLSQLTRGALAEMRLLLLELRPTALAQMKIEDLLRQLIQATISRTQIDISLTVESRCSLTSAIRIALYRIAQEALNNATRHAMATHIDVALYCTAERGELVVSDNGHGFDPANVPAGHLGIGIMRERAAAMGAAFEITSHANQGTRVSIVWSKVHLRE
jgi:PAS domain S-box-containing protein